MFMDWKKAGAGIGAAAAATLVVACLVFGMGQVARAFADLSNISFEGSTSAQVELLWNDNNDTAEKAERPTAEQWQTDWKPGVHLWYSLDDGETLQSINQEELEDLLIQGGIDPEVAAQRASDAFTIASVDEENFARWLVTTNETLPAKVRGTLAGDGDDGESGDAGDGDGAGAEGDDGESGDDAGDEGDGGEEEVVIDIKWYMSLSQDEGAAHSAFYVSPLGYDDEEKLLEAAKAGAVENTAQTSFEAHIVWRDNSNSYGTRNAIVSNLELYRYAGTADPELLEDVYADHVVLDRSDYNDYVVTLDNLPAYDEDGNPYTYYFAPKDGDVLPTGENGDYYVPVCENEGNYAVETGHLFDEGKAFVTLTGATAYTAVKTWVDGEAAEDDRPSTTFHLYRVAQGDAELELDENGNVILDEDGLPKIKTEGTITVEQVEAASPVRGYDEVAGPKTDSDFSIGLEDPEEEGEDPVSVLPKYDPMGHAYVYFTLETGLLGDYVARTDNDTSLYSAEIKETFSKLQKDGHDKFLLNGGAVENALESNKGIQATKTVLAEAMQSDDMRVVMMLQKSVNGGEWTNVTDDDVLESLSEDGPFYYSSDTDLGKRPSKDAESDEAAQGGEGSEADEDQKPYLMVEISGFSAEQPSITKVGPKVRSYDKETGYPNTYRWVEVSASHIDGKPVHSDYESIDENGKYPVNDGYGEFAPGVESTKTTLINQATQTDDGVVNLLVGETNVVIQKRWLNEAGEEVEGTDDAMFSITRNGELYKTVVLKADGTADVTPVGGETETITLSKAYYYSVKENRYDKRGAEYKYSVREAETQEWISRAKYETSVITDPDNENRQILQEKTIVTNQPGPNEYLEFDVEKAWLDGSDASSRKDVAIGLYRLGSEGCELVREGELTEANSWYYRFTINKQDDGDTVDNYIVKELSAGGVSVEYSATDAEIEAQQDTDAEQKYAGNEYVGTIYEAEAEDEDEAENASDLSLQYNYEVFITRDRETDNTADYVLANRRVGDLDIELVKTWNAGGTAFDAEFELQRKLSAEDEWSTVGEPFMLEAQQDEDGSYITTYTKSFEGLVKYNAKGELYDYRVIETKMGDSSTEGGMVLVKGGKIDYKGDNYTCVCGLGSQEGDTYIAGSAHHHTGDKYTWRSSNTRSKVFSTDLYKVWRDSGIENVDRPDVSYRMYRVAVSDEDYKSFLNDDGSVDHALVYEGVSELVDFSKLESYRYKTDLIWNTRWNEWAWSSNTDLVDRYDSKGNRYVYFVIETVGGDTGTYKTFYSNTDQTPSLEETSEVKNSEGVLNTPEAQLDKGFAIVSDGMIDFTGQDPEHVDTGYARTTINTRSGIRTIRGEKIWKLPPGWSIPEDQMPQVDIDLYVSTSGEKNASSRNSYTNSSFSIGEEESSITVKGEGGEDKTYKIEYADSVCLNKKSNAESDEGSNAGSGEGSEVAARENLYKFSFQDLPRYDEFGLSLQYFIYENAIAGAADDNYTTGVSTTMKGAASDFTMTNTFNFEKPYVEVSVTKQFALDEYAAVEKTPADLAPAKFSLYAIATDTQGEDAGDPILIATGTLDPSAVDEEGESILDGNGKATLVFDVCNAVLEHEQDKIPLASPAGGNFKFYVVEDGMPSGYKVKVDGKTVGAGEKAESGIVELVEPTTEDDANGTDGEAGSANGSEDTESGEEAEDPTYEGKVEFENVYGEETDVEATKTWDMGSNNVGIDLSDYYPDYVVVTVLRTYEALDGQPDPNFQTTITIEKQNGNTWTGKLENQQKYAPNGQAYTYYIKDESEQIYRMEDGQRKDVTSIYAKMFDTTYGSKTLKVSNKLKTQKLDVDKTWTSTAGNTVKQADLNRMVDWGYLPETITYQLYQKTVSGQSAAEGDGEESGNDGEAGDGSDSDDEGSSEIESDWAKVDGNGTTHTVTIKNTSGKDTSFAWAIAGLPLYDAEGNELKYCIEETTGKLSLLSGGSTESAEGKITDGVSYEGEKITTTTNTDTKVVFNNELKMSKIRIEKVWIDNDNQDRTRPGSVKFKITANGKSAEYTINNYNYDSTKRTGDYYQNKGDLIVYLPQLDGVEVSNYNSVYALTETVPSGYVQSAGPTWESKAAGTSEVLPTGSISNKLEAEKNAKRVTLTATKTWAGDGSWSEVTRPTVKYRLEFIPQGEKEYKAASDYSQAELQSLIGYNGATEIKLEYDANGNPLPVEFAGNYDGKTGMFRYWSDPSTPGIAELISYRVVEVMYNEQGEVISEQNAAYAVTVDSSKVGPSHTTSTNYSEAFTNTLKRGNLYVEKTWTTGDDDETLTWAQIKELIDDNQLPSSLKFTVEYKSGSAGTWQTATTVGSEGVVTIDMSKLFNGNGSVRATVAQNVPLKNANGEAIEYRVTELGDDSFAGLSFDVDGASPATVTPASSATDAATAAFENHVKTCSVSVKKVWSDDGNRDGLEKAVTVALMRTGETDPYGTLTLSKTNQWQGSWTNLPAVDGKTGADIEWTVVETTDLADTAIAYTYKVGNQEAATMVIGDGGAGLATITNTHEPYLTNVTVKKVWHDGGASSRPDVITVQLWKKWTDGSGAHDQAAETGTHDLTAADGWTYTWEKQYVNEPAGNKITYYVKEIDNPSNYEWASTEYQAAKAPVYKEESEGEVVLTNTELGTIDVKKIWKDTGVDSRPQTLKITAVGQDSASTKTYTGEVTVSSADRWEGSITNLPKYDSAGRAIEYTVTEETVEGYTVTYKVNGEAAAPATSQIVETPSITVTNTLDNPDKVTLRATKEFEGDSEGGISQISRPTVSFHLNYKIGSGDWVDATTVDADELAQTIGYRGDASKVVLVEADGTTATVEFSNLWQYELTDTRSEIQYKVTEVLTNGGETIELDADYWYGSDGATGSTTATGGTIEQTVTNTLATTNVSVSKEWELSSGVAIEDVAQYVEDGYLPATLSFRLEYSNNGGESWNTWSDNVFTFDTLDLAQGAQEIPVALPMKDKTGALLQWRAAEVLVSDSGSVTSLSDTLYNGIDYDETQILEQLSKTASENEFAFTNVLEVGSLKVQKLWVSDDLVEVVVHVTSDWDFSQTLTLSGDGWSETIENLPVYSPATGEKLVYTVTEEAVEGHKTYYLGGDADGIDLKLTCNETATASIKNVEDSRDENEASVAATKYFDESEGWSSLTRPSVTFQLWYLDPDTSEWVQVTEENKSVINASVGDQTITAQQYAEGVRTVWWDGLYRYWLDATQTSDLDDPEADEEREGQGDLIEYKIVEVMGSASAPYAADAEDVPFDPSKTEEYNATVKNTLQLYSVSVNKEWLLNGEAVDADTLKAYIEKGYLPSTVDVALQYSIDGSEPKTLQTKTLDVVDELLDGVEFQRVPKTDAEGQTIIWSFVEVDGQGNPLEGTRVDAAEYGSAVEVEPGGSATLSNTLYLGSLDVSKVWVDADNLAETRPESLTVNVYEEDDTEPVASVVLDEENDWTGSVDDLPIYAEGTKDLIDYTVAEESLDGYTVTYKVNDQESEEPPVVTLDVAERVQIDITNTAPLTPVGLVKSAYVNETCSADPEATEALPGVDFALYTMASEGEGDPLEVVTTAEDGSASFDGPDGLGYPEGSYILKEAYAPSPFLTSGPWDVTIADGAATIINAETGEQVLGQMIVDDQARVDLSVAKVNELDATEVVEGVEFGLYRTGSEGDTLVAQATTDEAGELGFEGLLAGVDYKLVELSAVDGYYLSKDFALVRFAADEAGNVVVESFDDGDDVASLDEGDMKVTWKDAPVVVRVNKVDKSGAAVKGAKLEVQDAKGNVIEKWESDGTPHEMEAVLETGATYTLVETKAPKGYKIADPVEFTVSAEAVAANQNLVIEVEMVDAKIPASEYGKTGTRALPMAALGLFLIAAGAGFGAYGLRSRRQPQPKHARK